MGQLQLLGLLIDHMILAIMRGHAITAELGKTFMPEAIFYQRSNEMVGIEQLCVTSFALKLEYFQVAKLHGVFVWQWEEICLTFTSLPYFSY